MKQVALTLVFFLATGWMLGGQEGRPNFSGRWEMDDEKSQMGPGMRAAGYKERLVIDHKDPKLRIDYTVWAEGNTLNVVYELTTDGAENRTTTPIGEEVSRTRWEGHKLITDCRMYGDRPAEGKYTRYLSEDGQTLFVEYGKGTKLVFRRG